MEPEKIVELLLGAPLQALLLYLLVREINAHEKTRQANREDEKLWIDRMIAVQNTRSELIEKFAGLMDKLEHRITFPS